jgi:hypothetical protein
VNPGGEPERDETGLPPVDIEIPDDARELDRDVQAYYRELRAQRRQQRGHRMRGSLAKDGIILPLLACCLILALITGTLLTVFTATSDQLGLSGSGATGKAAARPPASSRARSSATGSSAAASGTASGGATSRPTSPPTSGGTQAGAPAIPDVVPGVLPKAVIAVDGQAPIPVQGLHQTALVLIPAQCNCTAAVSWLIGVVTGAHARTYLIYTDSTRSSVEGLYRSLSGSQQAQAYLARAPDSALSSTVPDTLPDGKLTAIMLGPHKVAYATALRPGDDATTLIQALTH